MSRRWELAPLSIRVASLCVYLGLFCGLAGMAYHTTRDRIVIHKATEVATTYIQALAQGDRTTAIRMAGLPPMVTDSELGSETASREQRAVRNFLADPAVQEVLKLGEQASWESIGLRSRYRTGIVTDFSIGFIDKQSINPRPIVVTVRMVPPTKNSVETRNQWLIESINQSSL